MSKTKSEQFLRFPTRDRFEHWLLVFSFSLLALTGLVQKFASATISQNIIALLGGIELVRLIHRFGAIILMLEAVYHLGAISYKLLVKRVRPSLLPTIEDFRNALHALQHNLGLKKSGPRFGRYSYEEKFEYWAVVWGLAIMILTGFMLWNPIATTEILPGQYIPAAKSAHGNEALLAVLAIIIWHFYNVHFRHFNKSMFSGHLSREEMLEHHPLELAELEAREALPQSPKKGYAERRRLFFPIYAVVSALLLLGIYQFVSFEESALDTVEPAVQVDVYVPLNPTPQVDIDQLNGTDLMANLAVEIMQLSSPHFDAPSFQNWLDQLSVDEECSTCHSASGLPYYQSTGLTAEQPVSKGMFCETCHNDKSEFTIYDVGSVTFPNGVSVERPKEETNLCLSCHKGGTFGASLDSTLVGLEDDEIDPSLQFAGFHAAAPGATLYGAAANGAYQYEGNNYVGLTPHFYNDCTECHSLHELDVKVDTCDGCHEEVVTPEDIYEIRLSSTDYDGDTNITEGISEEITTLRELLFVAIQEYASNTAGESIVYDWEFSPYYFIDTNENGSADPGETSSQNLYSNWTPRLLQAAYNYHYSVMNSGGYAHNPMYIIQILYDSLESLGATDLSLTRP